MNVQYLFSRGQCAGTDIVVLVVCRQGHESGTQKDFHARRSRVVDALVWLQLAEPYYQNVQIDNAALQALPEACQLTGPLEMIKLALSSAREGEPDARPQQEGVTGDKEESESFLRPITGEGELENEAIGVLLRGRQRVLTEPGARATPGSVSVAWSHMEGTPLNDFRQLGLPLLYRYVLSGAVSFAVTVTPPTLDTYMPFVTPTYVFKYLQKHFSGDSGARSHFRVSSHPPFPRWLKKCGNGTGCSARSPFT